MNNSKKEEILLDSFNVLKDNLSKNISSIAEIIAKVSKINFDLSVEMWKYILNEGGKDINVNGYSYTQGIIYKLSNIHGKSKIIELLKSNEDIFNKCYSESSDVDYYLISD
ncbi:hypothetical protein [Macrococcoides caseolyticum]|uniref:hypothetical protein n=1 Tax=Macrococcoides caseolyticum TaxID=69966 RepID=UPI001F3FC2E2|nr:hypothetical protein [Macrococcus caseolyticus]MCE4956054.1 hypothetical protein [Macrococcus caseolyticus]